MPTSVATVEAITATFPHTLPHLTSMPSYETLQDLRILMKENASTIPCSLGGAAHGYLGLVVSDAIYTTIAPGTPFAIPLLPPHVPDIPIGTTQTGIGELVRQHSESQRIWQEYTNVHTALKNQLIKAVPAQCLIAIKHAHSGYANLLLRVMLAHLFDNYGDINTNDLQDNDNKFRQAWDPNTPIEMLIKQINDAVQYAADAGTPYTNQQILNNAYALVFNTGMYFDDVKTWDRLPALDKTWPRFGQHFSTAHKLLRRQQRTAQQGGYHANIVTDGDDDANIYRETATALTNLATATASDRASFANLVTNNTKLADQLAIALQRIAILEQQLPPAPTWAPPPTPAPYHPAPAPYRPAPAPVPAPYHNPGRGGAQPANRPKSYCWTHGYRVSKNHSSANCNTTNPTHRRDATYANNLNGNQDGKPNPTPT
jgi:hypothetical protein